VPGAAGFFNHKLPGREFLGKPLADQRVGT
jgi:hypothetical protein